LHRRADWRYRAGLLIVPPRPDCQTFSSGYLGGVTRRHFPSGEIEMTIANDALLTALGTNQFPVWDNQSAPNTTQATATRCTGQVSRFTSVLASGAAVLPSLLTEEAQSIAFVINDGANALAVFPFTGETRNGSANSALSVPAGQAAIFIKVTAAQIGKGGGIIPGSFANDWRSAIIP
jgi:hypothetical protein